jgi:toxin ParE1/3/4
MKPIRFHPEAEDEMIQAILYYESLQRDLGRRFLASIQESINRIRINPNLYPVIDLDVQRCLTKTFPFGILFRNSFDQIVIIAVMHLHRDPDYWKTR